MHNKDKLFLYGVQNTDSQKREDPLCTFGFLRQHRSGMYGMEGNSFSFASKPFPQLDKRNLLKVARIVLGNDVTYQGLLQTGAELTSGYFQDSQSYEKFRKSLPNNPAMIIPQTQDLLAKNIFAATTDYMLSHVSEFAKPEALDDFTVRYKSGKYGEASTHNTAKGTLTITAKGSWSDFHNVMDIQYSFADNIPHITAVGRTGTDLSYYGHKNLPQWEKVGAAKHIIDDLVEQLRVVR